MLQDTDLGLKTRAGCQCGFQSEPAETGIAHITQDSIIDVAREQKMLKGQLPRVIYHQVHWHTKKTSQGGGDSVLEAHMNTRHARERGAW